MVKKIKPSLMDKKIQIKFPHNNFKVGDIISSGSLQFIITEYRTGNKLEDLITFIFGVKFYKGYIMENYPQTKTKWQSFLMTLNKCLPKYWLKSRKTSKN